MLTMRETPKISERPAATKNSPEAVESPLTAWNRNALSDMAARVKPSGCDVRRERVERSRSGSVRLRGPELLHLGVGRQHGRAVDILDVAHGALAVLQRDLADIGTHGGLVVAGAIGERPERAVDLEARASRHHLL